MGPAPQDPAQEFIPNSVYLQIKSYRSLHLTLGHRAQGDSALHGDVPFPEEQGLFAQASPGGSDSLEPALSVCGHGKAEPGTAKELGGAHPNFHGELGPPPFPGEISHGKGRFPWSNVSVGDREQRGELGGGRGLTSWGSWRGWRCRRHCSCCVPGARSPCCPTPRPSYGQKRQSLSHGGEPNPVEPSSPGAPRYLFLMIQCLVPFCVP